MDNLLDLYTDYLLATPTQATCTGLSEVLHGQISHDRFTRLLSSGHLDSQSVWKHSKNLVKETVDSSDCVVVGVDDSIQEKPHSSENELICWHYDHTEGEMVKGINFLSAVLATEELSTPIAVEFVHKTETVVDEKGQLRRRSPVTKNELFRQMLRQCWQNTWFDYVTADSWFSSKENMRFITDELNREFVMAVKSNRVAALSEADKKAGCWHSIKTLAGQDQPLKVWLRGMDEPVLLLKQVFKNEDDSEGVRYMVASDLTLEASQMIGIYQKRWKTEEYHKSIKQCSSLGRSPAHTPETQQAHCIAAIISYVKLEKLNLKNRMNHFALKSQIWMEATRHALQSMSKLSTSPGKYAFLNA
ncbi:MAG: transposase [Balneolaceae bacterium]|nr:transposase [Balneolaceae bacterium]